MLANFNWVDYALFIIFFLSIIIGFVRGFVREIISLISLVAAFVIASTFSSEFAVYLTNTAFLHKILGQTGGNGAQSLSYLALSFSFAILFFATMLVGAIIGFLFNLIFGYGFLGIGNRLLGGIFGIGRGFLINLAIIFLVQLSPFADHEMWKKSDIVRTYQPIVQKLMIMISPSMQGVKAKLNETFENVKSQVSSMTSNAISGINPYH